MRRLAPGEYIVLAFHSSVPLCELPEPWSEHLPEPDEAYDLVWFGPEPAERKEGESDE